MNLHLCVVWVCWLERKLTVGVSEAGHIAGSCFVVENRAVLAGFWTFEFNEDGFPTYLYKSVWAAAESGLFGHDDKSCLKQ